MNKILIIDDDRELCALIKRSVQAENIEADFCNTGKDGLQKLKEQEYQLVVLDVMMPGMDGFETLEVSNNGINMLKGFEGCRLAAYQDSVGVWTIGYG